jgi:glycosyltransferase involved in cell wall biosynthesis
MVLGIVAARRLEGISVVLPALNERGNIGLAVARTRAAAARFAACVEVIVVDDGSTDGTAEEAQLAGAHVIRHASNRGYGAALRSGFSAAVQPWIFQMDSDNQFDPEQLVRLVDLAGDAQIVIGVRVRRADPWHRVWAGRAWNQLCRVAFGRIVRDIDCGFKLLNSAAISRLGLTADGAGISLELCVAARRAGLRIAEIEVEHRPRLIGSQTGLKSHVVMRGLLELYRLRRAAWRLRRTSAGVPSASVKARSPR